MGGHLQLQKKFLNQFLDFSKTLCIDLQRPQDLPLEQAVGFLVDLQDPPLEETLWVERK
jgi:hypothetical protein